MRTAPALALLTVGAVTALGMIPAQADPVADVKTVAAAGWLVGQLEDATHLPVPGGDHFDNTYGGTAYANQGENADVVFGLAATKTGGTKAAIALGYLATHIDDYADLSATQGGPYDGSIGKAALAAIVAGRSPTAFGGHDLLAALKTDECAATATTCTPGAPANIYAGISDSFVILAEARAGAADAPSAAAMTYFLSLQCADGGFSSGTAACGTGASDVDSTSYAIMALQAAGGHPAELANAVTWLSGQRASGGWWVAQGIPNVNSTGLATAALAAQGVDVTASRAWLLSQQVPAGKPGAGALAYGGTFTPTTSTATSPSVLATAQALVGLVDGGSLATVTSAGSTPNALAFIPVTTLPATTFAPGAHVVATAYGFAPGERVVAVVHSTPVTVATATSDPSGKVTEAFTLPASVPAGAHTLVLTGASSTLASSTAFSITAATSATTGVGVVPPQTTVTTAAGPGDLPATGLDGHRTTLLVELALAALTAGAGLLVLGRRRSA